MINEDSTSEAVYEAGKSLREETEKNGISDIALQISCYSHLSPNHLSNAVDTLERIYKASDTASNRMIAGRGFKAQLAHYNKKG